MLSKRADVSVRFQNELDNSELKKVYLARVQGKMQSTTLIIPMRCIDAKNFAWGVCKEDEPGAKHSETVFEAVYYCEADDSTIVRCHLKTGRTHQIRVHLQHLKHPILNDVNYGGRYVGNPYRTYVLSALSSINNNEIFEAEEQGQKESENSTKVEQQIERANDESSKIEKNEEEKKNNDGESLPEKVISEMLQKRPAPSQDASKAEDNELSAYYDFQEFSGKKPMEIFLHSKRYTFGDKVFEAADPYWASTFLHFPELPY